MKNRRWLLVGLILLGILIAAIVLNGVIRETIAPVVLAWVWRVTLMSRGFPQVLVWAFFIAMIPIIAVFSLIQGESDDMPEPLSEPPQYEGRVAGWQRQLSRLNEGDYYRERMQRGLSQLALETVAYIERVTPAEAKERLRADQLNLDEDVTRYLQVGLRAGPPRLSDRPANQTPQTLSETEIIVQFLENEMEVPRDE